MVRVFSVFHYRSQNIHTVADDVLASSLLDNEHIILAKSNHIIEILPLNQTADDVNHNDNHTRSGGLSFPTVDQVQHLVYCKNGNYIITIESRTGRRQSEKLFCRVYANWNVIDPLLGYSASIRARIAGKVTPTNNSDCLEVIEIPVRGTPAQIACCQMTGNIAIALDATIVFYKYITCTNDSTKYQYIDFRELPFVIDLEFTPDKLVIAEHCVGCLNHEYMTMFKIVELNCLQSDDMISANSFTSDISNSCAPGIGGKTTITGIIDFEEHRPDDWAVDITSTIDRFIPRKPSISEYRPVHIEMECKLRQLSDKGLVVQSEYMKDYTIKPLLKLRQREASDPFKCLVLKPIYISRMESSDTDSLSTLDHDLKSKYSNSFLGIAILVATANDGYIYQFSNNDKWMTEDTNFIATYPFTSPAVDVTMNDYVIQALTDRGMETYTHRIGHKLFSCYFEYNLRDDSFPIEACPRVEDPICLIGLRPFLGVKTMLCTDDNLVLLASNNITNYMDRKEHDTIWTIYNLKMPEPEIFYQDFEELAKSHIAESPSTYLHLMSEAHMIMRIAKEFYKIKQIDQQAILAKYDSKDCEHVFLASCRKLGDFCVLSDSREEYCLAFPYYTMGQIGITEVYDRVFELDRTKKQSLIGLVHTLKNMFIKCRHSSEDIGRLLTTIRTNIKHPKTITFGEELLELFLFEAPQEIAALTLRSQLFRDFMSSKVCEAINTKQEISDEDKLCLILECVRNNQTHQANDILISIPENRLFIVLIQYWCILFDSAHIKKTGKRVTTFSELTETYLLSSQAPSIQHCITNIFIYLMIETKVLSIDLLLKLLMDYLASRVGESSYGSAQQVLQILLESYYYNLYIIRRYTGTVSDQSIVIESMATTTSSSGFRCIQNHHQNSNSQQSDSCTIEHFYGESVHSDAMKILIRIYLGKLKKLQTSETDISMNRCGLFKFMRQNLAKLFEHHQMYGDQIDGEPNTIVATMGDGENQILFWEKRAKYLNFMKPVSEMHDLLETGVTMNEHMDDVQLTVVKLQALLCSSKLTRDILQEIIYFFEANAPFSGIDSFISILLPQTNCIDFFIDKYPQLLLEYAKSRMRLEVHWSEFLIRILGQKHEIIKNRSVEFFENLLTDILHYIVQNKRLTQVLKIFPVKDIESKMSGNNSEASSASQDEELLFTQYLSTAIDRDRAERLGDMIKTTGYQLYDTYNRNKQFFN